MELYWGLVSSRAVQTNHFISGVHSFLLLCSALRDSVKNKSASLLIGPLGKTLGGIPHVGVVDRWLATPRRARYSALIAFS